MGKPLDPDILFEDNHLLVLSKPAGLLSQGDISGEMNLVDWLRRYVGRNYIGLIHRLDRNTSGAMVIAKRSKAAERLTRALVDGVMIRTYLGWVEGHLSSPALWRHRLLKDPVKNQVRVLRPGQDEPKAQEAILHASPLNVGHWKGRPITAVEFRLETGRSHQIRVQASAEGHPLVGDRKYVSAPIGAQPASAAKSASAGRGHSPLDRLDFPRPALHSYRLEFPHPMSGETLRFTAPIPADLRPLSAAAPEAPSP